MIKQWTTRPLQELCKFQNGYAFKNKDYVEETEGRYEIFRMGNISRGGGFNPNASKVFVGSEVAESLGRFVLDKHDILMCMTDMKASMALLGHTALLPIGGKYLVNQRVGRITVSQTDVLDTRYLYYYTNSPDYIDYLRARANSGVQVNLSTAEIIDSPITFPDLPTQRKIASILSAYDDLIENNTRRIAILEEMAQAIYREWFVNFRFPGHEKVKLAQSTLGMIPEGWEVLPLGEVAEITMGTSPKGDTYNEDGLGTPLVNGPVEFADRFTKRVKWTTDPNKMSKARDLIVCVRGSTTGKYVKSDGEYCLGRGVCSIRCNHQSYVDLLFRDELPKLLAQTGGSTFPSWTAPQLKGHLVLSPPPTLLDDFEKIVSPTNEAVFVYTRKNHNLRTTRDLLLSKLISGQLDVEDLDIDLGMTAEALEEVTE